MALRVIAYDDVNERLVRTTKDPADILSGSSTGGAIPDIIAAGSNNISDTASSSSASFANPFPDTSYAIIANFTNTTDSLPLFQPINITSKTVNGFTTQWNNSLDSGNYSIDYIAVTPCSSFRADVYDLGSGVSSTGTKSFLSANTFAICGQIVRQTLGGYFLNPAFTSKTTTDYVASWNINTDSTAYDFEYAALSSSCPTLKSGVESINSGATELSVTFPFPALTSSSYALIPRFQNLVDGSILYQPITTTAKSISGFTVKWNTPVDSSNYALNWIVHVSV